MAATRPGPGPLVPYREKRSADRTPEPFGTIRPAPRGRPGRFVVQLHAARRRHYDFRLELGGVLVSWAVPRGPSLDPAEKRLAVHVEDHPLDYATFEGVIPPGNYGAGAVLVWDQGRWTAVEDPVEGLRRGKLLFDLHGYKLRGRWTLVRTRGGDEWLLIKKADTWSSTSRELADESILSGLTLDERRDPAARVAALTDALSRRKAARRRLLAREVTPMLAGTRDQPFSSDDWIFELKYDGFRLLLGRDGDRPELRFRGGRDVTAVFPDVARALVALPFGHLVLDGEVVVPDDEGRPSFQRLQRRVQLTRPAEADRAAVELPATVYVFDLLALEGFDLRSLPLVERKALLERVVPKSGPLQPALVVPGRGEALYGEVERLGFEGILAKKANAPYRGGRSTDWLKIRVEQTDDFAVIGFTRPRGSRHGFGALHLGLFEDGEIAYAGRAGSGFGDAELRDVAARLEAAPRTAPPARGNPPTGPGHVWVEPGLVCEVRFKERTDDGRLRQPVFLRFRPDKSPGECRRDGDGGAPLPASPPEERRIEVTNPDKVFWPAQGYTKRDLVEYYRTIAPSILPWLRDRPVVLTRYPDGIDGKSFYQKDAPGFVPGWIRTERIWSEHAGREIDYFVCDDADSLAYLANLGTIPLHAWASRVGRLTLPDWCVLDLDPKGAPFAHVVRVAREIRALCEEIGLPSFVKTSGASGLHVLLPLGGRCTYEQSRLLGELLGRVIVARLPKIATIARVVKARAGKVYVDYLQNRHGQTIAAPFSVRPLPGAPVSMPLRWSEVGARLDPARFTIRTAPSRVKRWRGDPCLDVLSAAPDLVRTLSRLGTLLGP